ncbi:MAG: CoA-binding protein [Pseudomonadota bacterium]
MVTDDDLRRALRQARIIAMVGASPDPARPSYGVGDYLAQRGYRVIGVNPHAAGQRLFGEEVVARLQDAPEADFLDIFRRSEAVPPIVDEALRVLPRLRCVWMQLGVQSDVAARAARSRGVLVVQNRCPKIEIRRLGLQ